MKVLIFLSAVAACVLAAEKKECFNQEVKYNRLRFGDVLKSCAKDFPEVTNEVYECCAKKLRLKQEKLGEFIKATAAKGMADYLGQVEKACSPKNGKLDRECFGEALIQRCNDMPEA